MIISRGTTKTNRSISIIVESKNIMEFIHIYDRNGIRIGYITMFNSNSGKTEITHTKVKTPKILKRVLKNECQIH